MLALALVILVCLLVAMRNLIHVLRGTQHGSWMIPSLVVLAGLAFFFLIRGDAYLDLSSLLPVAIGWAAAFGVIVASHLWMLRQAK